MRRYLRKLGRLAIGAGGILAVTFVLLEIALRIVPHGWNEAKLAVSPELVWQDRFLQMDTEVFFGGMHHEHPTRGWTTRPSATWRMST